jgi:hypothetical protein
MRKTQSLQDAVQATRLTGLSEKWSHAPVLPLSDKLTLNTDTLSNSKYLYAAPLPHPPALTGQQQV